MSAAPNPKPQQSPRPPKPAKQPKSSASVPQSSSSSDPFLVSDFAYDRCSVPLYDIGANLLSEHFDGVYHGRKHHESDLTAILQRAERCGVKRIIVTCGMLEEAKQAAQFVDQSPMLYYTVGIHPTRANEFEGPEGKAESVVASLLSLAADGHKSGKCVAVGECGLDYDRLQFCSKEVQLKHFERHFQLSEQLNLPLFLHDRNTEQDFLQILQRNRTRFPGAVVHSFTGSVQLMWEYVNLGLYIGINGCSLKTEENLQAVRELPLDRLLLETDAPYCGIKPTHASQSLVKTHFVEVKQPDKFQPGKLVKARNEPCTMIQVAEVVAALKGVSVQQLAAAVEENTLKLFWPNEWKEKQKNSNEGGNSSVVDQKSEEKQ